MQGNRDFCVGDRVRITKKTRYDHIKVGMTGTIVGFFVDNIAHIEWDLPKATYPFHDCNGLCQSGYGWNALLEWISLIDRPDEMDISVSDAEVFGLLHTKGVI